MSATTIGLPVAKLARAPLEAENSGSGVAWAAVIAGAFAAISTALILLTLAFGFGLAVVSPWPGLGTPAATVTGVAVVWLVVVHWLTAGLGGYLTGRLRTKWVGLHTDEVFFRDTANGFIMWAVATAFVAGLIMVAAAVTAGGVASTAGGAASGVAAGATEQAKNSYVLDTLFRSDHASAADADMKLQSGRILLHAATTGTMPSSDKAYLARAVAAETGLSPAESDARVNAVLADVNTAKVKAQAVVDAARKDAAAASILTAIAMLVGAFVACVAAALGGKQRDA